MLTQKELKQKVLELVTTDRIVCKKNGNVEVKRGYFYHNGVTAESWAARVMERIGNFANLVEARDDYADWPKTSYFTAVIVAK